MNRLMVKPGRGYIKIALIFYFLAIFFLVLLVITSYASSHDDTLEAILVFCGMPIVAGMVPTIIYRNVKMVFDNDGVVSTNILGISRMYSWKDITEVRVLYNSQYRCRIYAHGKTIGSAIFSYDGYIQLLDLLIKKRMLENSDVVEKAKRRATIVQTDSQTQE